MEEHVEEPTLTRLEMFEGIYKSLILEDTKNFAEHRLKGERPPVVGCDFVVHLGHEWNPYSFRDALRLYLEEKFTLNPQLLPYIDGSYAVTYAVEGDCIKIRVQVRFDEGHTEVTFKSDDLEQANPCIKWVKGGGVTEKNN